MFTYNQTKSIFSLSGIIIQLHPMEAKCLCEYVAMPRPIVFPAPLWWVKMSLHVSKHWKIFRLLL